MKRADQHPVTSHSQQPESFDPDTVISNESGIDMPCEKDIEQPQTPSMGALPVDNMGSIKSGNEWKSTEEEHVHVDPAKENEKTETGEGLVATGTGPDPEHSD